ncbi:MAG: helix-turn-helix transcriptional regulator [Phenylobacterium sp.]|uniref:TetR/AcrR family transcriptional regulator n=1 Tax=Phenylobacterium sp. TaxID=1871053 RepID=UPI001A627562|nr:TetR/AcrR family transcriptional regulator [Phenylobacterium sp.]MBL8773382.1 helix-turn-helix transcriptional regulator [Phenylobacterium sp.]
MSAVPKPDRRRARTRAALLRAGHELFAVRAVEAVSIDDIVAAADVAKGSFYNHFPDKEALARAVADEVRQGVEGLASRVAAEAADPAERIARALCGFVRQALEDPSAVRVGLQLFRGAHIPDFPSNAGVRADVRAGLASGLFGGVGAEAAVLMAVGVVQIAVARVLEPEGGEPAERRRAAALSRDLAAGLLRGLGLDPAQARAVAARAAADILGPGAAG